MAKHPHKLMLHNKKTWRCMSEGCNYFIHTGLQYILPGKLAECWDCHDPFTIDEHALKEDMPRCDVCRQLRPIVQSVPVEQIKPTEIEIDPARMKLYKELGIVK